MTAFSEKSLTVESYRAEKAAVENIYRLITTHSLAETRAMGRDRKLHSYHLAEKYFDRGRGKLSSAGRLRTKEIFGQMVEQYATDYTAAEILKFLEEVYTFAVVESGYGNENRTFQLMIASLRGQVLYYKDKFKPEVTAEESEKKKNKPPRKIKKWIRRIALGLVASFGIGEVTGVNPYIYEMGKAVLGADYDAAKLDKDLRDQITGGRSRKIEETPAWLSQELEQDNQIVFTELIEGPTNTPTNLPTETATSRATLTPTQQIEQVETQISEESPTTTPLPTESFEPTHPPTLEPTATDIQEPTASPTATQQPTETQLPTQEAVELSPEVDTMLEYIFGGDFYQAIVEAREARLDFRSLESIPEGYKEVTENGVTFMVPEGLPSYMYYVYSPVTFAQSLGAYQVPAEERQAFLENRINDGMIHIAISGLDYRPQYSGVRNGFVGRTDAPMIMSINIQTGNIVLTSIARDIWSPEVAYLFGGSEASQKLTVMSWLHGNPVTRTDPGFSRMVYENICGCAIDGVVQMNFDAVAELIDELFPQGIEIEVTESIHDENFPDGGFHIEPGTHRMNGTTAVQYTRSRYDSPEGDISRQNRQRQVVMAVMQGVVTEFKDELFNGRPRAALDVFDQFLRITTTEISDYEQHRQELDDGERDAAQESYMRSFGLSPWIILEHLSSVGEQLKTPEGIGVLTAIATDDDGRQQLLDLRSGEAFVTIQIGPEHTNRNANTNVGYWGGARQEISAAHSAN